MKKTYQLYFLLSSWQGGACSRSNLYFLIFLYRYSSKPRVMESQQVVLKEEWILVYILSTLLKTQRFDYLSWWHLWHFGCLWLWNWRQTITFIAKEAGEMYTCELPFYRLYKNRQDQNYTSYAKLRIELRPFYSILSPCQRANQGWFRRLGCSATGRSGAPLPTPCEKVQVWSWVLPWS